MAHCGCIVSRNICRRISLLIISRSTTSISAGTHGFTRVPARSLSLSHYRLQSNRKDETSSKHEQQNFQSQEHDDFTSTSDSSTSDSSESDFGQTEDEEYEHSVRQRILQASLIHVHQHGWTKKALEAGAGDEGLPPVAQGMFPRGGAELVHYFYAKCNADMAESLKQEMELREKEGSEKPKGKQLIRDALEMRLRMNVPYLDTWSQAMAIQTLPANAVESWTNLLNLVDEIWYHAGDRSVDYNWYTKRLALAAVYKTSEIYMLQDKSPDLQDTWDFMDRKLQDFQTFGSSKKKIEQNLTVLKEGLYASCILGRNILGMNSRNR